MFFKYKVNIYDDTYDNEKEDEGLIWARNYTEATEKIIDDYGSDVLIDMYLMAINIEGDSCLTIQELSLTFDIPLDGNKRNKNM